MNPAQPAAAGDDPAASGSVLAGAVPALPPGTPGAARPSPPARLVIFFLAGYQRFISPLLGPRCRFYPSCSAYAMGAVQVHGAARGTLLAGLRLAKCHPFHPGGLDPVPPARSGPAADGPRRMTAGQARPYAAAGRPAAETMREQAGG